MVEWEDKTDAFSESQRYWQGRYLEICEVAYNKLECNLYSCEDDDWEIYFKIGKMYGVSYAPESEAWEKRENIMEDMEEEYEKNGDEPSEEFFNAFNEKYGIDIINAFFRF